MGLLESFSYKSPKERQYESNQYLKWAFPYGDNQKAIIENLLKELTDEKLNIALSVYLIGKQAAIGDWRDDKDKLLLEEAISPIQRILQSKNKNIVAIYLALIEADFNVDETLNYPDVVTIKKRAEEIVQEL